MIKRGLIFFVHLILVVFAIYAIVSEHDWVFTTIVGFIGFVFYSLLIIFALIGVLGHIKTLLQGEDFLNLK